MTEPQYVHRPWDNSPLVELPPRPDGKPHLSECGLFIDLDVGCTCDDYSPEWTL
jgi:hypothetical protein